MSKIQQYITGNKVKPRDCAYHTNRSIKNSRGEITGSIRVLVPKDTAMVEYKCPDCSHEAYTEAQWKRPFSVKCGKCGIKISVPKLRDQAKREAKAEAAAKSDSK